MPIQIDELIPDNQSLQIRVSLSGFLRDDMNNGSNLNDAFDDPFFDQNPGAQLPSDNFMNDNMFFQPDNNPEDTVLIDTTHKPDQDM